jgi:hypothetical protein
VLCICAELLAIFCRSGAWIYELRTPAERSFLHASRLAFREAKRLKMKGPRRISAQRILARGSASPSNHDTLSQKQIASSWLVNLSEKRGLR